MSYATLTAVTGDVLTFDYTRDGETESFVYSFIYKDLARVLRAGSGDADKFDCAQIIESDEGWCVPIPLSECASRIGRSYEDA